MPGSLIILSNTSRITTIDQDIQLGFGVNLAVGWSAAEQPGVPEALQPWTWSEIKQVMVAWVAIPAMTVVGTPFTAGIVPQEGIPVWTQDSPLPKRLTEHFMKVAANPENLKWPQTEPTTGDYRKTGVSKDARPWSSFLMQLATAAFPVPQALRLSLLIRVDPPGDPSLRLVVAPLLAPSTPFPATSRTPTQAPLALANYQGGVARWNYTTGSPDIYTLTVPCPQDKPQRDDVIDLSSQWIASPPSAEGAFEEDWQAQLELRVASGFRVARFIRDYLHTSSSETEVPGKEGAATQLLNMGIAALRDAAGCGVFTGVNGQRPVDRILSVDHGEANNRPVVLTDDDWQVINAAEGSLFPTLASWKAFLKESLPEARSLGILSDGSYPPFAESAAQFARLVEITENASRYPYVIQKDSTGNLPTATTLAPRGLWGLFLDQWDLILKNTPDAALSAQKKTDMNRRLRSEAERGATDDIPRLDLGALLQDELLGHYWPSYITSNKSAGSQGTELTADCFTQYVLYHAHTRWGLPPPVPPATVALPSRPAKFFPPTQAGALAPASLVTDFENKLADWIGQVQKTLRPSTPAGVTNVPQALTFQVATLRPNQEKQGENNDPLRNFSGVGFLMREVGSDKWLSLNTVDMYNENVDLSVGPVLAPFPLHYRSELQQVCVSYNNHPIMAAAPLAEPDMASVVLNDTRVPPEQYLERPFRYRYSSGTKIPGLKFGHRYEVSVFTVANAGPLPKEIADPASPCRLRQSPNVPDAVVRKNIPYQRRVPVGTLRFCDVDPGKSDQPMNLPRIPDNVAPRARYIETLRTSKLTYAEAITLVSDDSARNEFPLILLSDTQWDHPAARSKASFAVKLPQVTWDCWDRWVTGTGVSDDTRVDIIEDAFKRGAKGNTAPDDQLKACLDDPAVARVLFFELYKENNGDLDDKTVSSGWVNVPPSTTPLGTASGPIDKNNAGAVTVTCVWNGSGSPLEPSDAISSISVNAVEGEVYRLSVYACVPVDRVENSSDSPLPRFATGSGVRTGEARVEKRNSTGTSYFLVSPSYVLIEAATAKMPGGDDLWNALRAEFRIENGREHVLVTIGPNEPKIQDAKPFRYLYRAEIDRQAWRWQGRPADFHPDLHSNATDDVSAWVAVEFGDRSDGNLIQTDMGSRADSSLVARLASGCRSFVHEEILADGDKKHDLRGQHFRFSVRAYSRYEGLMPKDGAVVRATENLQGGTVTNRWINTFVPSRKRAPLPLPRVKLVLPLTQAYAEAPVGNPGLLVVFNEPWYEAGGLGEGLKVEVGMASSPTDSKEEKFYVEYGADPIVHPYDKTKLFSDPYSAGTLPVEFPGSEPLDQASIPQNLNLRLIGPVGHYFDSDNTSALFVGTSFVIPAPTYSKDVSDARKNAALGWQFAHLRFQRTLIYREPLSQTQPLVYKAGADWPLRKLYSESTDPFWVQYLPEFALFDGWTGSDKSNSNPIQISALRPIVDVNHNSLQLWDTRKHAPVTLQPTEPTLNNFQLYLILTKRIYDVTGSPDQEIYLATYAQQNSSWTTDTDLGALGLANSDSYRVRIIEVQFTASQVCSVQRPSASNPSDLWSALFNDNSTPVLGKNTPCDVPGRIVRISPPIDALSS